ncbi:MAG: CDP-glucose 4,6-dehydratase [Patescibacteria group bacterium]
MDKLFGGIYKGKRVFITGHTGFKGSWLALWLTKLGAHVVGYAKDIPTQPSHYQLLQLPLTSISGDILDFSHLHKVMEEEQPNIVFHLAAQPIVRASYEDPVQTFATNVLGTVHVLEACRKNSSVQAIVNVTSDKCYQNNEWDRGYREDDPMGGADPYSASKGCAEIAAQAYRHSFFNPTRVTKNHQMQLLADARAGNVIGGGDWAQDRLLPDLMRGASVGATTIIRNPQATRPWQHVLEPLSGYLQLGWKLLQGATDYAGNWNFGPNDDAGLTVQEVITRSQKYWDAVHYTIDENTRYVHEAKLLQLDASKARTQLQWKSLWDNEKTFSKTVEWYKDYYQNGHVNSNRDLAEYVSDARKADLLWART